MSSHGGVADSTAMLLPKTQEPKAQDSDEVAGHICHGPGIPEQSTEEPSRDAILSRQLQDLSKIMLELLNEDDPLSNPYAQRYLAETYKSEASIPESGMKAESGESHFANVAEFRKNNPNYHVDVYNTTAQVNRETGRAMVWATTRASGLPTLPSGASRESVTAMHWKKQTGGFWILFRTTGIRGPGDYT